MLSIIHRIYKIGLCQLMYYFPEISISMNQCMENSEKIRSMLPKGMIQKFNCFDVVMSKIEDEFKESNLPARAFLKKSIEEMLEGKDTPVICYAFPDFMID